jgi:hypothetical protein
MSWPALRNVGSYGLRACPHAQAASVLLATSADQVNLNVAAARRQLLGESFADFVSLPGQLSEYPACSCRNGGESLARN